MQTERKMALLLYFFLSTVLMWIIYAVVAPFFARITGIDTQSAGWALLAVAAFACVLTAVRLVRDESPLACLGKVASRRPNGGSDKALAEAATRTYGSVNRKGKK